MRILRTIGFIGALFAAAAPAVSEATAARRGEETLVEVKVRPAVPRAGGVVTVEVWIDGARNVGSVPFTLLYDPAVLEHVPSAAREGTFLRRGGATTTFLTAPGARQAGVTVGLSRLGAGEGARGRGLLCRLVFRALAPGTTPLTLSRASVLDPAASPLPASFEGTIVTVRGSR